MAKISINYYVLAGLLILTIILILIFTLRSTPKGHEITLPPNHKYILYWTPFWWHQDFGIGFGTGPFSDCEYKNCFATNDKTVMPIEKFDAILFHASIYKPETHGKPSVRSEKQIYIFYNVEAPAYIAPNFSQFNYFYNWTMTYRFDSDLVARHGEFTEEQTNYTLPNIEFILNKTKQIAWFVSHCNTSSKREVLAREMQKFIPVDIYGKCGPLECERIQKNELSSPKCYDMVEEKYKFYLSFENSICKDYSTEKLYNLLKKNVVPIVYGAGNYSLSAPPYSVVDANDFETVEQLTNYLNYLSQNVTEYLKYFEWKKHFRIIPSNKACKICKKLNEPLKHSVYDDLQSWSWGKSSDICKTGANLPNIVKNIS